MHQRRFLLVSIRIIAIAAFVHLVFSAATFAQTSNVNLAWEPLSGADVDRYMVYVGTAPSAQDAGVYTVSGAETSYAFAATPGVLYYFSVSAVTSEGIESPRSEEISGAIPLLAPPGNRTSTVGVPIVAVHLSADDPDDGIVRFTHTGLPPGLVLDSDTGIISGIPESIGTFTVEVFASDDVLTSSRSFEWTVRGSGSGDTTAPSLTINSPVPGQSVISSTLTVSGTASDSGLGDSGILRVTVNGQLASGGTASGGRTAYWSRTLTLSGTSNTILVEALDGIGNYAAELVTVTRDAAAPSLVISSHTSGQTVTSSTITVSGTASDSGRGGNGISRVTVNGSTASGGTSTGNDTANWSRSVTLSGGLNTVTVVAVDGAGNARTQSTSITYTPQSSQSLTIASLTSNLASPQARETSIGFTAVAGGGTAPYQFKWWVENGGVWSVAQDWSRISTFNWQPTETATYTIAVWARSAGVTTDEAQAVAQVPYVIARGVSSGGSSGTPLSITSLTSDRSSPRSVGTTINFTAAAAGGTAPYQFKWWVQSGGVWNVAREWGSSNTLTWQPTTAGSYMVAVWVRNSGVTTDASQALAQVPYVISSVVSPPSDTQQLSITSLTSNRSSPRPVGSTINFTAAAAGGMAPYQFKWWVQSGGVWYVAREWSTTETLSWQPTTAGSYMVAVWVRNAESTADASEALAQVPYVISPIDGSTESDSSGSSGNTPLAITGLWSSRASPQVPGRLITFSTAATGGRAPYQFKWWVFDGSSWSVAQDWSTSANLSWQPMIEGMYVVAVWVRNDGVTADASQGLAQVPYVISP